MVTDLLRNLFDILHGLCTYLVLQFPLQLVSSINHHSYLHSELRFRFFASRLSDRLHGIFPAISSLLFIKSTIVEYLFISILYHIDSLLHARALRDLYLSISRIEILENEFFVWRI